MLYDGRVQKASARKQFRSKTAASTSLNVKKAAKLKMLSYNNLDYDVESLDSTQLVDALRGEWILVLCNAYDHFMFSYHLLENKKICP